MSYTNTSLRTQTAKEAVRMNPQNYLGSDDATGAFHTFKEILANAVDEANSGYGKEIIITLNNNVIAIQDFGRGLPMDYNENEKKYNWEIVFTILHGGGKFKDDRSNYNSSLGQNGLGAAITQLTSEFCEVISVRDGYKYSMSFSKGEPNGELKKEKTKEHTGTTVIWKPDLEVFTDIELKESDVIDWIKLQAVVNSGVSFKFNSNEYIYKDGINDYIKEYSNNEIISFTAEGIGKDTPSRPAYKVEGRVAFSFTDTPLSLFFHNSNPLEYGGSPKKAMETAFVEFFDKALKQQGYKQTLTFDDIKDNLAYISATYTQIPPSFENQTKKSISNKFIQEFIFSQLVSNLTSWSASNQLEFEKVCSQLKVNCEARVAAANHKLITKQKLTKSISGMRNRVDNFIDCRSKDVTKKELYICEGMSALGSLKQARDSNTHAIFRIRGKIKSAYKAKAADVLSSQLVKDIIQLVGTGINSKTTKCEVENCRFDKIIFACFTGDTVVNTSEGPFTFEELANRNLSSTYVYSKDRVGNTVLKLAENIRQTSTSKIIYEITTSDGQTHKSTPDHYFIDNKGRFIQAQALKIGDRLMNSNSCMIGYLPDVSKDAGRVLDSIKYLIDKKLQFNEFNYDFYRDKRAPRFGSILDYFNSYIEVCTLAYATRPTTDYEEAHSYFAYDIENSGYEVVDVNVVEYLEPVPVYCMTVRDTHNFQINDSVFVKNCDQDSDGYHIVSLLLTLFYTFMPELIKAKKVYCLMTPLYEVFYKDGTYKYCYSDNEKEMAIKKKPVKVVNRNKGLGEVSAEVMATCLDESTRHLLQFTLEDAEKAKLYIDMFMGASSEARKQYITDNADKYEVEFE